MTRGGSGVVIISYKSATCRPKLRHGLLPRRRSCIVPDRLEQAAGHREPVLMPRELPRTHTQTCAACLRVPPDPRETPSRVATRRRAWTVHRLRLRRHRRHPRLTRLHRQ